MFKLKFLLSIILINGLSVVSSQMESTTVNPFPTYVCRVNEAGWCVFQYVELRYESYRFVPISENISAADVKKILFDASTVNRFGPDICNTFPNLEQLGLDDVSLSWITNDAFEKCSNLIVFSARQNIIDELSSSIFNGLKSIQIIRLMDNEIGRIRTESISSLTELRVLELQNNKLTEFSTEIVSKNCNLQELRLDGNELMDLDTY